MSEAKKPKTECTNSNTEENICVTCSTQGECENVFILTFEDTRFSNIFHSSMGFKLSEDSLLKYMCLACINTIISFHTFKEEAFKSYERLSKAETAATISASKVEVEAPVEAQVKESPEDKSEINQHFVFVSIDDPNLVDCNEAESDNGIELDVDIKKELSENLKQEDSDVPLEKPVKKSGKIVKRVRATEAQNTWQCSYCDKIISMDNPAEIKKHKYKKCKDSSKIRQTVVSDDYLLLCCRCCDFKTKCEDEFKKHCVHHKGTDGFAVPLKNFGCTKCEYKSHRKRDVQRHVLTHLTENEMQMIPCTQCDFSTRYISSLYKHKRRVHGGEKFSLKKTYKCDNCDFSTAYKNSLVSHQLQHREPVERELYYCYLCAFQTIHKANLRSHVKIHLNQEEIRKFVCEICGFSTNYQKTQKRHLLTHERSQKRKMDREEERLQLQLSKVSASMQATERRGRRRQVGGMVLQCDVCSYKTYHAQSLRIHKIRHKPDDEVTHYYCDKCTYKSRSNKTLKGHLITHMDPETVKTYQCEYCAYRTAYSSALRVHLRRHVPTEDNTFVCTECDFKTIYRPNFLAHQNLHKDPKDVVKFKCMWCDYQSNFQSNISKHELSHHGKKRIRREWTIKKSESIGYAEKIKRIRIHECPVCHKMYTKTIIKEHILRHGEVKPVKCKNCGKRVSSNQALKQHMMLHEGKKYICDFCNKGFTQQFLLKEHLTVHDKDKTFVCPTCGITFPNLTRVRQHQYKHKKMPTQPSGVPHICDVCGNKFSSTKTLEIHRTKHDSEETFECGLCGKKYGHRALLTSHIWLHLAKFRCLKCFKIYQKDYIRKHKCEPLPDGQVFDEFLPNECRQCGEILQHGNIERHLRRHEAKLCKICGVRVSGGARKFQFHLNNHKFKCDLCNKGFAKKESFILHTKNEVCVRINLNKIKKLSQ